MKRLTKSILSAAVWAATFCAGTAHAALHAPEQSALKKLFDDTSGLTSADGWGTNTDGCTWKGVTCAGAPGGEQHVVGLDLHFKSLTGSTRLDFSALTQLKTLRLDQNTLTGPFPNLTNLTELTNLELFSNRFTGDIPDFANLGLTKLENIAVYNNRLSGSTPSLGALTQLKVFSAAGNQLNGTIGSLTGAAALEEFNVQNNRSAGQNGLIGPIPSLAGLDKLRKFSAGNNQLSNITDLSNLPALETFDANRNLLSGPIPPLEKLPALQSLYLNENELSGPIPDLSDLSSLVTLHLQYNQLSGQLPASLTNLPKLRFMQIQNNRLVGSPPTPPGSVKASNGSVTMCPNPLRNSTDSAINAAWDAITNTGNGPWAVGCTGSYDVTPRIFDASGNEVANNTIGSIDPYETQILAHGSTFSFELTAASGYRLRPPVPSSCATYDLSGNTFTVSNAVRNCTFEVTFAPALDPGDKDGECGPDHGQALSAPPTRLCTVGTASGITGTGPWNWSCAGTGTTGATAQCTAQLADGQGFTVTAAATGPGTAAPATQEVGRGGRGTITATPDTNSHLASVSGCGATFVGNVVTTAPITESCTVTLTFAAGSAPAVQAVPTLGEWGLMLLAALMGGTGLYLRRRA